MSGLISILTILLSLTAGAWAEQPPKTSWIRQIGGPGHESACGVGVDDAGDIYIAGSTRGDLGGPADETADVYVAKFDADGTMLWITQAETDVAVNCRGMAVGGGGIYVGGKTYGDYAAPNAGDSDAFVCKFDTDGNFIWARQFGMKGADGAYAVAADAAGNAYICGYTQVGFADQDENKHDSFVAKYDTNGNLLWSRQIATDRWELAYAVAADADGNVYVSGWTEGALDTANAGGNDAFVRKYDAEGAVLWTRQLGTASSDESQALAVDADGSVYVGGSTTDDLGGPGFGSYDAFLIKLDGDGTRLWGVQVGTGQYDRGDFVAVDSAGNAYLWGGTDGEIEECESGEFLPAEGRKDIFLTRVDTDGKIAWTKQIGTDEWESANAVAIDADDNVYLCGGTGGDLGGPGAGETDAFLIKLTAPQEDPDDE